MKIFTIWNVSKCKNYKYWLLRIPGKGAQKCEKYSPWLNAGESDDTFHISLCTLSLLLV